ncbi:hypothetical protein [Sulfurovum riftiae]|uniref:Lipoprotein n=1 Tax=Sulfurovum riftiae TaxID=1630136 RepID=A0A151CF16_9BACT|nr:hypothetical protein [Sulfurovum riftiae]KYJ86064.1 hypothetical protein AS592_01465 [Sulfurovum riftiae]
MRYLKHVLILLLVLVLWGCAEPSYTKQNSAYIVLKTPTFKYADMGFIYENSDELKAEIYGSGQALMTLTVTKGSVCMSRLKCMSKITFNSQVLSSEYPPDTIEQIFRGKPVFGGANMVQKRNGFTQKLIKTDKYHIEYSVLNNQILFRDTINEILIKVIKQ